MIDIKENKTVLGLLIAIPIVVLILSIVFYFAFRSSVSSNTTDIDNSEPRYINGDKYTVKITGDRYETELKDDFYDRPVEDVLKDIDRINEQTQGLTGLSSSKSLEGTSDEELKFIQQNEEAFRKAEQKWIEEQKGLYTGTDIEHNE